MKTMVEYVGEAAKKELTSERPKATRIIYPGSPTPSRIYRGLVFVVGHPWRLWNARLVMHILEALGGRDIPWNRFDMDTSEIMFAIDEETQKVVWSGIDTGGRDLIWVNYNEGWVQNSYICNGTRFIGIDNIVNGLSHWILPASVPDVKSIRTGKWYCGDWHMMGPNLYERDSAHRSFVWNVMRGVEHYADWFNGQLEPKEKYKSLHVCCDWANFPCSTTIKDNSAIVLDTYIDYTERGTYAFLQANRSHSIVSEENVVNPRVSLELHRWKREPRPYNYDYMPELRTIRQYATAGQEPPWDQDSVRILMMDWDDDRMGEYYRDEIQDKALQTWAILSGMLNTTQDLIYNNGSEAQSLEAEHVKQPKTKSIMAETKKKSMSFTDKMLERFKGQYIPEKCEDFALTIDGQIVAKCPAGPSMVFNAIVDDEVVSYPTEMIVDVPMFTILRPAEQVKVGDIVCLSGQSTGSRYGKVTSVTKNSKTGKVSSLKVIRFNGTEDGASVIKDAILKQPLVEVVINFFTGTSNTPGGFNPMMFLLLDGKGGDMKDLLMMSMMMGGQNPFTGTSNNTPGGFNPMMLLLMDGKGGDMKDLLMMSMIMGGQNPFAAFQPITKPATKPATPQATPAESEE